MEPSQKKFGVKNFYSKFFHGKSRPKEDPCKTSILRFDRIFRNYKKGCRRKKPSPCGILFFYVFYGSMRLKLPTAPPWNLCSAVRIFPNFSVAPLISAI